LVGVSAPQTHFFALGIKIYRSFIHISSENISVFYPHINRCMYRSFIHVFRSFTHTHFGLLPTLISVFYPHMLFERQAIPMDRMVFFFTKAFFKSFFKSKRRLRLFFFYKKAYKVESDYYQLIGILKTHSHYSEFEEKIFR